MKRLAPALFFLAACAAPPPPPQPQPSPTRQWADVREELTVVNKRFSRASAENAINDEQRITLGEQLQTARKAVEMAEALLPDGGEKFQGYLEAARSLIAKLTAHEPLKGR